jgi:hypothetical protein
MDRHTVLALLATLMLARPAEAHIDPGAGSILTQLVLGGAAGLLVVLKLYWHRLRRRFSRRSEVDGTDPSGRLE